MYLPIGFSIDVAIELGELIQQAYAQFEAFEKETDWKLPAKYTLKGVLDYVLTPQKSINKSISSFEATLRKLSRLKVKEVVKIPIGFLAQCQNKIYLILRGTQTSNEWVKDFTINLEPCIFTDHGKVHEGFQRTYSLIRSDINESLSTISAKLPIYVAGHSLGAALATLASLDIELSTKNRVSALITYGSPRVGDDTFVKAFNMHFHNRSFRIVNTSDIVTSIPLPIPIVGAVGGYFSHVDTPVDMTIQKDDLGKNHSMQTYLSKMNEWRTHQGFFNKLLIKSV
jgi:triacylglycerol lipase